MRRSARREPLSWTGIARSFRLNFGANCPLLKWGSPSGEHAAPGRLRSRKTQEILEHLSFRVRGTHPGYRWLNLVVRHEVGVATTRSPAPQRGRIASGLGSRRAEQARHPRSTNPALPRQSHRCHRLGRDVGLHLDPSGGVLAERAGRGRPGAAPAGCRRRRPPPFKRPPRGSGQRPIGPGRPTRPLPASGPRTEP
jgi:hypothetical protein